MTEPRRLQASLSATAPRPAPVDRLLCAAIELLAADRFPEFTLEDAAARAEVALEDARALFANADALIVLLLRQAQRLLHSAYKPVRERVAGALLLLHAAFRPAAASAAYFSIPVSRDDLAALSGTTKETASRLLSEFRQEGLLTTQGSRISIRGLENLREVASLYD